MRQSKLTKKILRAGIKQYLAGNKRIGYCLVALGLPVSQLAMFVRFRESMMKIGVMGYEQGQRARREAQGTRTEAK